MDPAHTAGMAREKLQTRADPDTVKDVRSYAEEKGISEAEAVRRLLRAGIEAEAHVMGVGSRSVAKINETARIVGGAMIGAALAYLFMTAVI